MSGTFTTYGTFVTGSILAKSIESDEIAVTDSLSIDDVYSIKSDAGKLHIKNNNKNILNISKNGDLIISGEFQGKLKESNFDHLSLNLDTLHVDKIYGNVGIIDTFVTDSLATKTLAVSEVLSTLQFAAQEAVITESLAAKEIATKEFAMAAIDINGQINGSELPTVNISDSYILNVDSNSNLRFTKDNNNVLELSENRATFPGDVHITGSLNADVDETNLRKLKELNIELLTVDNITASGNLDVNGLITANSANMQNASVDSLASRMVSVAESLTSQNVSVTNKLIANGTIEGQLTKDNLNNITSLDLENLNVNQLNAVNATLSGNLSAANATLSGDISANNGIFLSDLSAVNALLGGDLSVNNINMTDLSAVNMVLSGTINAQNGNIATLVTEALISKEIETNDFYIVDDGDNNYKFDIHNADLRVQYGDIEVMTLST
tara:strand:- start:184 stop:1503 length:1320 start_codon:yes stop_codon:yes gene_type:complete